MDYSLLLAVEKNKERKDTLSSRYNQADVSTKELAIRATKRHMFESSCGKYIYHVAIIDYLQAFNWEKWGESFAKTNLLMRDGRLISAVEPEFYAKRFK